MPPDLLDLLDADELDGIDWGSRATVRFVPSDQITDRADRSEQ